MGRIEPMHKEKDHVKLSVSRRHTPMTITIGRPEVSQAEQTTLIGQSGIHREAPAGMTLVGADVEVPLVTGGVRRYIKSVSEQVWVSR